MNKKSMRRKLVKITNRVRKAYESRDKSLDHDADAPTLPLDKWAHGEVGRFFRPMKTQISFRIDNDVLAWACQHKPWSEAFC